MFYIILVYIIATSFSLFVILKIVSAVWLYFFYDRRIIKTSEDLVGTTANTIEEFRGRGIVQSAVEPMINAKRKALEGKLNKLQLSRQLFLDRIHFLISIKK